MNLFGHHFLFLSDAQLPVAKAALADAGHEVAHFAGNVFTRALAAAPTIALGTAVRGAIDAAEATGVPGPEKLTKAIAEAVPAVIEYAGKGGVAAAKADAEKFAELLIESALTEIKTTKLGAIAGAILQVAAPELEAAIGTAA